MAIIVQKYGGSSVADVEKLGQVADKVVATRRAGFDVVVVVSAMGKTTDELIALARRVSRDPPRRELDMLVTTGERVSMALLATAIHARGEAAISFTGSQSGIITNDRHFDARIIEVRPHRIEDELARGKVVIIAGYQGMSYKREITTLGRGGSDTTAVAMAAALGAERCEIYSDVDGVYSADPRVVAEAKHLPEVDFAMLQEMAEAGAKVLNAQAVEWARRAKVALYARKTADPVGPSGHPEKQTVAREVVDHEGHVARAVVGMDRVVRVTCATLHLARFAEAAASLELPLLDVSASGAEASAIVPLLNVPDWERRRSRLEQDLGKTVALTEGCAVASVVGDGLTASGALPRFLSVLERTGAQCSSVVAGPLRLAATVPAEKLGDVQRALHEAFV